MTKLYSGISRLYYKTYHNTTVVSNQYCLNTKGFCCVTPIYKFSLTVVSFIPQSQISFLLFYFLWRVLLWKHFINIRFYYFEKLFYLPTLKSRERTFFFLVWMGYTRNWWDYQLEEVQLSISSVQENPGHYKGLTI